MFEMMPMNERSWGRTLRSTGGGNILDVPFEPVVEAMKDFGALLFRGFEVGPGDFAEFSDRFSARTLGRLHDGQNRRDVAGDEKTSTVNLGQQLIGPHAELAYSPQRPDLLWFQCTRPASSRGETTLYDGIEIWSSMPASLREAFIAQDLRYRFADAGPELWPLFTGVRADRATTAQLLAGQPGVECTLRDNGLIDIEYVVPAAAPARYQGTSAFANSIIPTADSEISFADRQVISRDIRRSLLGLCTRLGAAIEWQAGDIAMIDNSRMMHGRMPFEDPEREVHVRMTMAAF